MSDGTEVDATLTTSERLTPSEYAGKDHSFAAEIYGQLRSRSGNLVFSPLSIRAALGMALVGARGDTESQMREALRLPPPHEAAVGRVLERIRTETGSGDVVVANSFWSQEGAPLEASFVDQLMSHYHAAGRVLDFRHHAEEARKTINRWVEEETRRKIRELISKGGLTSDTSLVLANAAYFKGRWKSPFDAELTWDVPFRLQGGQTRKTPMMRNQRTVAYQEADDYQAIALDYEGGAYSMVILLPGNPEGLPDLERAFSASTIRDVVDRMAPHKVDVAIPRFAFAWSPKDLVSSLRALGMTLAFEPGAADFSGINGMAPSDPQSIWISSVAHEACVEVNEEGTEAAAATATYFAMSLEHKPSPVPVFRADHPFLFAIRDHRSGAILFLGRVADPTAMA